jgi:hypothetical protein
MKIIYTFISQILGVTLLDKYLFLDTEKILLELSPVLRTIEANTPILVIEESVEEFVRS